MRKALRLVGLGLMFAAHVLGSSQFRPSPHPELQSSQYGALATTIGQIRQLDRASYRVGFTRTPGEFYRLFQECQRTGTVEEFRKLLDDLNPMVRVMGLLCLADRLSSEDFAATSVILAHDSATIKFTNGCVLDQRVSVKALREQLIKRAFLF